ncbi:MAG: hypothetical protein ACI4U3_01355 [Traorella sp.]
MEYIFELLFELLFESAIEASKSHKIPKYIRYLLIAMISLFIIVVIGLLFLVGILSLKENIFLGIIFISIGLFMLIMSILNLERHI